jgi:hypothetical protein
MQSDLERAMKITKKRNVTYFGRKAQVWEAREAGASGVRYTFTRWIDACCEKNGSLPAGTVTRRRVKGDFSRGTLVVLEEKRVVTGVDIIE